MRVVTFASGSGGNCTLVSDNNCHILIDAGISARRIVNGLKEYSITPDMLSGILITHEHSDHIAGIKTLIKNYNIPIFAPRTVGNYLAYSIAGVEDCLQELIPGEETGIGSFGVLPFSTPHDTPQSVGYRITGSKIFGFCTDCGHLTDEVIGGLLGCDAAVIEANHDVEMLISGPYHPNLKRRILSDNGHLSNEACAELACKMFKSGTKHFILGHMSRENNLPSQALKVIKAALLNECAQIDKDYTMVVAPEKEHYILNLEDESLC